MSHITKTIRVDETIYNGLLELYPMATFTNIAEKAFKDMLEREGKAAAPTKIGKGNSSNKQRQDKARSEMLVVLEGLTPEQIDQVKANPRRYAKTLQDITGLTKGQTDKQAKMRRKK